jgi:DNA-binding response OmpR family regulator
MKPKILIVSDEPETATAWGFSLDQIGMESRLISTDDPVLSILAEMLPDMIVLEDFNVEVEEIELCRKIRAEVVIPILFLTTKSDESFLLETYRAGASETISFPITPRLFQAKVKAWLRYTRNLPLKALEKIKLEEFRLDNDLKQLTFASGQVVNLSVLETRLLFILMSHPGKAFQTSHLVERVWGYFGGGDTHLLKNLIYRLRRKIEADPANPRHLVTEGLYGYKFLARE